MRSTQALMALPVQVVHWQMQSILTWRKTLACERLQQVQGRVMDGQYVNVPFIDGMNEPVKKLFDDGNACIQSFWWLVQWDPAHWLHKVFRKFKDSSFVDRLLKRVALHHHLFSHTKIHSVAQHRAKDSIRSYKRLCPSKVYEFQLHDV